MFIRLLKKGCMLGLLLCVFAAGASAEMMRLAFGYETELPEGVTITQEEWNPESDVIVYKIIGYCDSAERCFTGIVFRRDEEFKNVDAAESEIKHARGESFGFIKNGFGIVVDFSWKMDKENEDKAEQLTEECLDKYIELQKKPDVNLNAVKEEKKLPGRSSIFSSGYISEKLENSVKYTVADGRYEIEIGMEEDTDALHYQFLEVKEGSVDGLYYAATVDNGTVVDEYTTYQYMKLPSDFPQDVEYMPDKEYLEMIEYALNALGEEKASLLRDLLVKDFGLKDPDIITNEEMKVNHWILQEQIENLHAGGWNTTAFKSNNEKKQRATRLCRYWEIFDESIEYHRDYLINGIRWKEVNGALIGGYMGGISHCAIFDGALHFVRGNLNLRSLSRMDDVEVKAREEVQNTEENMGYEEIEEPKKDDYRVVNTKSSPLTLRKTPENGGAKVLSISKGEYVKIIEDGEWPLIEYNGVQGYVNGKYLK